MLLLKLVTGELGNGALDIMLNDDWHTLLGVRVHNIVDSLLHALGERVFNLRAIHAVERFGRGLIEHLLIKLAIDLDFELHGTDVHANLN